MPKTTANDLLIQQAIGEMKEATKTIAENTRVMSDNLVKLNDTNILHMTKSGEEHKSLDEKLNMIMKNYWWVIIALGIIVLIVLGYKEILRFIPAQV